MMTGVEVSRCTTSSSLEKLKHKKKKNIFQRVLHPMSAGVEQQLRSPYIAQH